MVLNALAVDPRKTWKGPWRWYTESHLNCCVDLEEMKETGITFGTFSCLAQCQGLDVTARYASEVTIDDFREAVRKACVEDSDSQNETAGPFLVVSYTRKVIQQTGTGHFSPIAAYDEVSDQLLVCDTARFKYGAHFIPLTLMYEAMLPVDPETGKSRGFVLLSFRGDNESHSAGMPQSILFQTSQHDHAVQQEYKEFLSGRKDAPVTWEEVLAYWTRDGKDKSFIWKMTKPQLNPTDKNALAAIDSIRKLIRDMMRAGSTNEPALVNDCGPGASRMICFEPQEAIFVVYLASLDQDKRRAIVMDADSSEPLETKQQLLAEAELLQLAVEMSDELSIGLED